MLDQARLNRALADRYAIEGEIGSGGMATVFLAEDLKHRRKVAVKVLSPEISAIVGTERFLAEIETTANLQHPHVLPLFDSGEADGLLYYVMPFVEGESLRDRLDRETQLPVEDAVRIAREVADGLGHAHALGVIHRDIKPENILLAGDHALIADFGIARAVTVAGGTRLTETGLSLGTPQYMSPEQASGEADVDARSDVYALGCITFEMLAGEAPYTGPNAQAIIAKVLTQPVPGLRQARETAPPSVEAAVARALAKLPADRWQTTGQFAKALVATGGAGAEAWRLPAGAEGPFSVTAALRGKGRWVVPIGLLFLIAAVALGWLLARVFGPTPVPNPPMSFTITPLGQGVPGGLTHRLAVSPDGRTIAYASQGQGLVLHPLGLEDPVVVGGGNVPFYSPDGEWLGFVRNNTIMRMAARGGTPSAVSSTSERAQPYGATWRNDSTVIFVGADLLLWEASDRGGTPRAITTFADTATELGHVWPQAIDDGRRLVFTMLGATRRESRVVVENLETGQRTVVADPGTYGRYLPTGHIIYSDSNGTLLAVPFDLHRNEVTGASFAVETGVRVGYGMGPALYAVSEAGTLAFIRGSDYENSRFVWVNGAGEEVAQVGLPVTVESAALSPDGQAIVVYLAQPGHDDVYTIDTESGDRTRKTFGPGDEENPVWSPDGRRLAYHSAMSGLDHRIEILDLESSAAPVVIYSPGRAWLYPTSWSRGGWLAFGRADFERQQDLYAIRVDSSEHVIPVAVTTASESQAQFSPNGRWLAYMSNETGRLEVYVVSFPELLGKQQVSDGGGTYPLWSLDEREFLFYSLRERQYLSVSVMVEGEVFRWGPPRPLPVSGLVGVAPDGERYLVQRANPDSRAREIHVITNWFEVLREKEESG